MTFLISRPIITIVIIAALLAGLWFLLTRAPVYLPRLDDSAPPPPDENARVFGFATLTNPLVRLVVLGRAAPAEPAILRGWDRNRRDLRATQDFMLKGVVFTVTPEEMIRLDRYERTGRKYRRDLMTLEDGETAWVYRLIGTTGPEALAD
ncbi:MAG: gamma-glutamylcyclotransferase [Rhodobacteraceae bacterium]|nr:gamma-glutamylcyclotransferase [Paracoccaceae bacterium]